MRFTKYYSQIKKQSNGLVVLISSVFVVGIVIYGLLINQNNHQIELTRQHGLELVRVISEMPYDQIVNEKHNSGVLALTKYYLGDPKFAYSLVTDKQGYTQARTQQPGLIIPHRTPPYDPSGWLAEYHYEHNSSGREILEFQSPVIEEGALVGFVRLAFYKPTIAISSEQIPFFASISLPIILIAGLFLLLMRREMKPLKNIGDVISDSIRTNNVDKIKLQAGNDLTEFVDKVNLYVHETKEKISQLTDKNRDLETSSKVLSYQQAKIQSVLHAIPEGMMVFDEAGKISFSNVKVSTLFDMDEDIINSTSLDWCRIEKVKVFLDRIIRSPLSNYINEAVEFSPINLSDKKYIVNAYPLFSPKNQSQIQGTLVLFRDYTEESLAKNSRGEFVAHVAHELKNPLNVLAMYSESLLREEGESREFRIEAVNVIQDEVERLSMLINNLLNITKIEMGSMNIDRQRVKLKDLLVDAFSTIQRSSASSQINFKLDLPGDVPSLYADKDLLRIAFNNLLTNAVKYSDAEDTVTMSVSEIDDTIQISVTDTGIGISKKDQAMIFDKFFRSDSEGVRSRSGHGLGLSLVRDIVSLHHGKIDIKSDEGVGTEITIVLENNMNMLERVV
ncbi:MAG: sensor histidine kinase [Gammaproteobacteria bacterium]